MPYLNEKVLREFWNLREKSVLLNAVVPYVENRWQHSAPYGTSMP